MRSDEDFQRLVAEFPLLLSEKVIWRRELMAHYGLLFDSFGLLEFTMQMCVGTVKLIRWPRFKSSNPEQRREERIRIDSSLLKMSFGQMLSEAVRLGILIDQVPDLRILRDRRNYFAHHFFRENHHHIDNDDKAIDMILSMSYVRRKAVFVDRQCMSSGLNVRHAIDPSRWTQWNLAQGTDVDGQPFPDPVSSRGPMFGWEKDE